MMRALEITATVAIAMFPAVFVTNRPSGIRVTQPPPPAIEKFVGAVIVAIVVVPVMWVTPVVSATVVADATVETAKASNLRFKSRNVPVVPLLISSSPTPARMMPIS